MQEPKKKHECPICGGPLKKTIGAASRIKYWECVKNGATCFRVRHSADVKA